MKKVLNVTNIILLQTHEARVFLVTVSCISRRDSFSYPLLFSYPVSLAQSILNGNLNSIELDLVNQIKLT